jgi:hypothetical protein
MSDGKASPGKKFAPPPAEIWNGMVDAGAAYRAGRLSIGDPGPTRPRETDIIRLRNSSGSDRAKGHILWIDGKAITDLDEESIWLVGKTPTADGYFAILKEPIANAGLGRAQVSGACLAKVNVLNTGHTRAKATAGSFVLDSADSGPLEIVYAPSGTGELECVVRFGNDVPAIVIMTPSGGIPARSGTTVGKANCTIYSISSGDVLTSTGRTVSVVNLSTTAVAGSVYGQAKRAAGRWVIDYEEC